MRFGCCVPIERLPLVRETGFDYAELPVAALIPEASESEWAARKQELLTHDVPIEGFNVLLPSGLRIVGPDLDTDGIHRYVKTAFSRMQEVGGRNLSFGSGGARRIPDGFPIEEARRQLCSIIGTMGQLGEQHGITVNIEFLNRKETNVIVSLLEAKTYADESNQPAVKILADLYHMMEEGEPVSDVLLVAERLGYVHVADTGRRHPGSGTYPYVEFASVLKQIGYDGPISVECNWGEQPSDEMRSSAAFLRQVFG